MLCVYSQQETKEVKAKVMMALMKVYLLLWAVGESVDETVVCSVCFVPDSVATML